MLGASNVSILSCQISNFSYGVAAFSSSGLAIEGSNVSSNYMSNIYLNSTSNSTIRDNYLARSLSWQGSLFLANGSSSDLVLNNTIAYNQLYGVNVSSSGETFSNNKVNVTSQFGFYCSPANSYPVSSSGSGNICYNNYGCAFLTCSGANLPANISKITLPEQRLRVRLHKPAGHLHPPAEHRHGALPEPEQPGIIEPDPALHSDKGAGT